MAATADGQMSRVSSPLAYSWGDWWQVTKRTVVQMGTDNLSLVAAGVAFWSMLALFPLLAALISLYGFVSDTETVASNLESISRHAPAGAADIIGGQIEAITSASKDSLQVASIVGVLISLWSAKAAVTALIGGLHVVYNERNDRSMIASIGIDYALTVLMAFIFLVALGAIVILPTVINILPFGPLTDWLIAIIRWPVVLAAMLLGIGVIYRYGPARRRAQLSWISPGALVALALWLIASGGFSWYVANFANYNETYGSLGAVVGLLMWFWITAYVVLVGAEINSELELHTSADTTIDPEKPKGERGAFVADNTPAERDQMAAHRRETIGEMPPADDASDTPAASEPEPRKVGLEEAKAAGRERERSRSGE